MLSPSPSTVTHPALTVYRVCYNTRARFRDVRDRLLYHRLCRGSEVCYQQTTMSVECGSPSDQWHEEIQPWSDVATACRFHWLDMPERVKYKLCMMMRRCQDGTAPQHLTAHWAPVSETASRQYFHSAASYDL